MKGEKRSQTDPSLEDVRARSGLFVSILVGATRKLRLGWRSISLAISVPGVLLLVGDYLAMVYEEKTVLSVLLQIAGILLYVPIAIVVHRVMLLDVASVSTMSWMRWGRREFLFVQHWILFIFAVAVFVIPVAIVFGELEASIVAVVVSAWIFGRIMLVFPGTAIGMHENVLWSWRLTRNHKALVLAICVAVPIMLAIPVAPVALLGLPEMLVTVVSLFLGLVVGVLTIAVLSETYSQLVYLYHDEFEEQ